MQNVVFLCIYSYCWHLSSTYLNVCVKYVREVLDLLVIMYIACDLFRIFAVEKTQNKYT